MKTEKLTVDEVVKQINVKTGHYFLDRNDLETDEEVNALTKSYNNNIASLIKAYAHQCCDEAIKKKFTIPEEIRK